MSWNARLENLLMTIGAANILQRTDDEAVIPWGLFPRVRCSDPALETRLAEFVASEPALHTYAASGSLLILRGREKKAIRESC